MAKRITTIYGSKWRRPVPISLLLYIRDFLVNFYPFSSLPKWWVKLCYGHDTRFVFFVHPRRPEDIFIALPFLKFLKHLIPERIFARFMAFFPPFVLEKTGIANGIQGIVISSLALPECLLKDRRLALREAIRGIRFSHKITSAKYFGLGGLWPMVTRRGLALKSQAAIFGKQITSGHSGTAISIYLMIEAIAQLAELPLNSLAIAVVGIGKMGSSVSKILGSMVERLTLIDINDARLHVVEQELKRLYPKLAINTVNAGKINRPLKEILADNHLAICTTSNVERIFKPIDIPDDFAIIDDSRPEAIPRVLSGSRKLVLEGGLLKFPAFSSTYDYGFGINGNAFGCFAETYLLALDGGNELRATVGNVDAENFSKMLAFSRSAGIEVGDFKTSNQTVDTHQIRNIIRKRHEIIMTRSTSDRYV